MGINVYEIKLSREKKSHHFKVLKLIPPRLVNLESTIVMVGGKSPVAGLLS